MERTATQPVQNDRHRYLNIVYFVESARSHTVRINLRYARWGIGALAIMFAWAAGSVFWIVSLRWQVQETRERLESSLTTIFDYQIKNDKVFELAYPAEATKSYYSEAAQLASNNPTLESKSPTGGNDEAISSKPQPVTSPPDSKSTGAAKLSTSLPPSATSGRQEEKPSKPALQQTATTSQSQPNAPTPTARVESAAIAQATATSTPATSAPSTTANTSKQGEDSQSLIQVSGAKISRNGGTIELVFDINNRRQERAAGYIWAVAAFTGPSGKTIHSGAPNHVQIEADSGKIKSFKTAYRFAIQRYKKKDFEFKAPATKDWKLTKMTIHFTDTNHEKEEVINVPVEQLATSQFMEKPTTDTSF